MTTQIIQSVQDEILDISSFPQDDAKMWLTYNSFSAFHSL